MTVKPTQPWLAPGVPSPDAPGDKFAQLLAKPGILAAPGAHDALSGLLAKRAGFHCLYVSGAALTASMGLPDLGVMALDELIAATRHIARATDLPLIVDGDTGYGEALNVMRLVRELESAGAAAVQIEDQVMPKKCGHLNDKQLIPAEEMARKIGAARSARTHLRIIARTDAAADGIERAVERARLYLDAGADVIFPEALTSEADFRHMRAAIDAPLLANMTEFGRTPYLSADQFAEIGFDVVIWPVSSLRVASKAIESLYRHLAQTGETHTQLDRMQTRAELYETIGYAAYEALDETIAASVVPDTPD